MNRKKIFITIGILILLLLSVLAIMLIRKLMILNKFSSANDVFSSNNYHYSFYLNNDKTQKCEVYYKDGKKLERISQNGELTSIKWIDEKSDKGIVLNPVSQTIDSLSKNSISFTSDKIINDTLNLILSNKLKSAINYSIKAEHDNGANYYKLVVQLVGVASNEYYFDKDTGTFSKASFSDSIVSMNEIEENVVTDNDVKEPELADYSSENN